MKQSQQEFGAKLFLNIEKNSFSTLRNLGQKIGSK
jgi:hypothetical protein